NAAGEIEFRGRLDSQVKLRGYRIELGEIEQVLEGHEHIEGSVVVLSGEGEDSIRNLVGYYTSRDGLEWTEVKRYLEERLPAYMIPTHLIRVEAFVLTNNGKIDKSKLPEVRHGYLLDGKKYVAPATKLEFELVAIWEEIFGNDQIGITDDFFELGGNSLEAIRLISHMMKKLDVQVELSELFESPTIAAITQKIKVRDKTEFEQIPVIRLQENYPLTNAQKRFWIMDQLSENDRSAYNMPMCYEMRGILSMESVGRSF
ncbi:phosphopantetheine-binding protein, partial [Mucilaginibacter sp. RCC_168]|uniref:phosphopantetheine-binding protein n=1 Tax=Mucilaginibacter sp. RCC_168 TaxID=3239221 RepID=UPI003523D31B